ncbi:DNA recombination protein RmuC, partial [Patescibacteria group bacterium]|nr:DNA recombination protein RmuC [Patescibacteria group bacterium]
MEYFIISLLVLIILGLSIGLFLLFKKKSGEGNGESFLMLQQQLSQLSQAMDGKMNESARAIQEQSGQNAKIIRNVTERLTKLDDTNKQVMGFAEQLQSLENILTNPKQRGILGEYYLETVLKNVLPPSGYQMQYDLGDGEIVDAAVFIKDKILPIDSKFSLDNYNRIVKEKDANRRAQLEK